LANKSDDGAHSPRAHPPSRLAFGLERLGLAPLICPVAAALLALALSIVAAFGITRISVDDSLSQLFRSDTAEFRQYEELTKRFPSSEFDVLIVVEADDLLARDNLAKLRDLVTDLHFVDGMRGLISLFSARNAARDGGTPPPLFPEVLPEGEAYQRLVEAVRDNEIVHGKLLSEDGALALVVISLDEERTAKLGLEKVIGSIEGIIAETLQGSSLKAQLAGAPVMQLEIRNAVTRDRVIYNALGFAGGLLVALVFFRRPAFVIAAAAPPLIAILWSLGALGWLDVRLNMFLNVMTPLVMVMGFSDSMQIMFAARDRLLAGDDKIAALRWAVLVVGPACVVTVATAALSFLALTWSDSHLIRTFGAAGALSTLISYIAVITLTPLFGLLLIRPRDARAPLRGSDAAVDFLRAFCARTARFSTRAPVLTTLASAIVIAGLTLVYANLEPRYRLADQVPDREQAVQASQRLDAKLAGANPFHILVELPPGRALYDAETLALLGQIHAIVETEAGIGNVLSLETLRAWLERNSNTSDVAVLKAYVEMLPEHLARRFIAADEKSALITGRIPDADASAILPVVQKLEAALEPVRQANPGFRLSVTGLAAIAARNSAAMIGQLNASLTVEMLVVAAFIGLAFRSVTVMVVSVMPGLFPIVASGAVLWALGEGLQFASVVALTIAFGLGLDATIHYLNRLRLEESEGGDPVESIVRASVLVGPALILTTLVLACGLGVTVLSDLPSLRLFGWLSAATLIAALAGDLLILPASVALMRKITNAISSARTPPRISTGD
jgi:predicted RND superfamily exporter protein